MFRVKKKRSRKKYKIFSETKRTLCYVLCTVIYLILFCLGVDSFFSTETFFERPNIFYISKEKIMNIEIGNTICLQMQ